LNCCKAKMNSNSRPFPPKHKGGVVRKRVHRENMLRVEVQKQKTIKICPSCPHGNVIQFKIYNLCVPLPLLKDDEVPGKAEKLEIIEAVKADLEEFRDLTTVPHELLTYRRCSHPKVFLSQFNMVMTQFGFIFILFLFPLGTVGIRDTTGTDGFMHLWPVIGRLLGIQD